MKLDLNLQDDLLVLKYKPKAFDDVRQYSIAKENGEWPIKFFTATTDMKDFIGNVVNVKDNYCTVDMYYRCGQIEVPNIIAKESVKIGDRVMVSEYICIDGHFRLIATKKRILDNNLTFINVGWSNENKSRVIRIDPYFGDSKIIDSAPHFGRLSL